jgi:hypothetical protein
VAQNLKKIQNERGSIQTLIFKTIRELKDGKYESLRKIVDEEYQRRDALHNTIQKYVDEMIFIRLMDMYVILDL